MREGTSVALGGPGTGMDRNPVALKSVEEFGNRDSGWIDHSAALHFRYQASALDLGLALRPGEGVPTAFALVGHASRRRWPNDPVTVRGCGLSWFSAFRYVNFADIRFVRPALAYRRDYRGG
jgi:hypothetical protein